MNLPPMTEPAIQPVVRNQEKGILRALLYFDIFNYPLTETEIEEFSPLPKGDDLRSSLDSLVDQRVIYRFDQYYTLHNQYPLITRRVLGNRQAERQLKVARRISQYISMFPFVRAVLLSGSISKGYMDEQSDIDYFIITEPGRLWLVRSAMAFIRRVFFLNSRKYLCTNYFIDSQSLEISEKNIFTAIEIATLKPMYGKSCIHTFQTVNQWSRKYLPNHRPQNGIGNDGIRPIKTILEKVLSSASFDRFDRWLMGRSLARWEKKYNHLLNAGDFSIAFQSTRNVSRSHPGFYQKKVLSKYESKIKEFESTHGFSLAL